MSTPLAIPSRRSKNVAKTASQREITLFIGGCYG